MKDDIVNYLNQVAKPELIEMFPLLTHQIEELINYSIAGKMTRSMLFLYCFEQVSRPKEKVTTLSTYDRCYSVVCFLEFLQSMLLIHDDVMDNSSKRRGAYSMNYKYSIDKNENIVNRKYGDNIAICMGDTSFIIANYYLNKSKLKNDIFKRVHYLLMQTCLGQMMDLKIGKDYDDIIKTFKLKTGSYTFAMPLLLGLSDIDLSIGEIQNIIKVGYDLGVIFQIYDDYRGIFDIHQDKENNDVFENKDTLFKYFLYENHNSHDLSKFFGKNDFDLDDLHKLLTRYKIIEQIQQISTKHKEKVIVSLDNLSKKLGGIDFSLLISEMSRYAILH